MLTKNHDTLTDEVKKHIEADAVIQGKYWTGEQGCFIGCLAHSSDPLALQEKFGLPLPLVRVCENIFETLPEDEAKAFFADLPAAVGRDGKDLSRVHWGFLASELRALPETFSETQVAVDAVIAGMDKLFTGGEWPLEDARAAGAAADAAEAAAGAAADAADAAADAACVAALAARAAGAARDCAAADAADAAADAACAAADAACAAADAACAAALAARAAGAARDCAAADAARDCAAADAAGAAADATPPRCRQRDTILKLIKEA